MEEHVKSLLPRERLMVLSSGVSVPLVDDTRLSTSAVKLAKAYVIPPKTEMAVLVKADREGLSLLKPLYVKGRLLYACNYVSCLPAPGECFLITIANFGDTVACMQPGTTVGIATNIEQVLLLDDDVDEKLEWRQEVPMDEIPESIREQALAMLSKHASLWDGRLSQIDSVSHRVRLLEDRSFSSRTELDLLPVPRNKPRSVECLRKTSSSLLRPNGRRQLSWYLSEMAECAFVLTIVN
jgi:hypothetical protein